MRAPHTFVRLTFATLCTTIVLAARQQPADPFRSGREVLEVHASVQDATGRPLTDLQPADFTVRVDGEPRRVLTAHLFGTDAAHVTNDVVPVPRFARNTDTPPGRAVVFAIDRESIRSGSERPLIDTAAKMLDALSPADAVGAFGLPAGGIDLTRDHAAVAAAIRTMTGTAPDSGWQHAMSWDEAAAYERNDRTTIATVVERECPKIRRTSAFEDPQMRCPPELERQAQEMLLVGRARAQTVLARLSELIGRLGGLRAPKHLIVISGGLPFDLDLLSRYRDLAVRAAQAHVALFVVQLDQPAFDASDRGHFANVFGGQQYAAGLGNIAASTGGAFYQGVGRATGVFDRIAAEINYFYQVGVESRPSDADGKSHRVEVKVNRPGAHVLAPAETAAAPARPSAGGMIARALTEPTDVADLPLEVATYITHSSDLEKVRVMISATVSNGSTPAEWGYAILDGAKVIGGARDVIDSSSAQPWSATASVEVPPGRYRLRTAIVDADGRMGTLELPFTAALRTAGTVQASDLIVGAVAGGQAVPRAHVRQDEPGVAMIELSSGGTLAGTTGELQLIRGGTAVPALTRPLVLRTREQDKSVVIGEALLDWSALPPGTYTASAVLARAGAAFARVSRVIEIVPGAPADTPPPAHPAETARHNPELDDALQRVGQYVSEYGQQASLIIGVERYEQRYPNAPSGEPTSRRLTADFVLVKTAGTAAGWTGFRGVVDVDGKPIPDRQDRLEKLFRSDAPDVAEARRIADESARFNIGPTRRNFNEPTSALFFMLPATQSRFAFTPKGHTRVGGADTWEIDFEEKSRPTLIKTADGHDVAAHGTIWVVPADGTVARTRLVLTGFAGPGSSSSIDVTYARDARLQLWLPATLSERHAGMIRQVSTRGRGMGATVQAVMTGTATYSDFKRFDTATEIK